MTTTTLPTDVQPTIELKDVLKEPVVQPLAGTRTGTKATFSWPGIKPLKAGAK